MTLEKEKRMRENFAAMVKKMVVDAGLEHLTLSPMKNMMRCRQEQCASVTPSFMVDGAENFSASNTQTGR
jgi:hypothetical protein